MSQNTRWSLGPKGKISIGPYIVDHAAAQRIRDNGLGWYLTGFATNDTELHRTKICFRILGTSGNPGNARQAEITAQGPGSEHARWSHRVATWRRQNAKDAPL